MNAPARQVSPTVDRELIPGTPVGRRHRRDWFFIGLYAWTALVILFLFAPVALVFINSLGSERFVRFPPTSLTLDWYRQIPAEFIRAFSLSLKLGGLVAVGGCLLGVPAALALSRGRFLSRHAIDIFLRAPLQVPWLVTGVAFLNYYFLLRKQTGMLATDSMLGLVLAHLLVVTPYVFATVVARLARYDESVEEVAAGLGAGNWTIFRKITLPIIGPAVFAGAFMAFIVSFDNVPVSIFLTGTDTVPFPVALYFSLEFDLNRAQYAVATLATLFTSGLVLIVHRWVGETGSTHP
jgi:putative spermidine/putrescine transport system permease protein